MDDLDREIEDILQAFALSTHEGARGRLRMDVEILRELSAAPAERRRMPKRTAQSVAKSVAKLLELGRQYGFAGAAHVRALRELKRAAEIDLLLPAKSGPDVRPWLGAARELLLEDWRFLSPTEDGKPRADGLWQRGLPSPALAFLERCCKLIDPSVNADAILYEKQAAGEPGSDEERITAYNAWSETEIAKKMFERDED